jgi:2-phospho-L-lactate guanylyltransferase
MILIPVKSLENAKRRLAPVLDDGQRRALAAAMLEDVFSAVAAWRERPPVAVVTGDGHARSRAEHYGFEVIADEAEPGESGAIEMATRLCEERGWEASLVIPADVPLVTADELAVLLSSCPRAGVVLAPSADMRGSNAVLRRPAGLIPLRFGDDSCMPHLRAARATGKPFCVVSLPGLALDVDRPADLAALLAAPGSTRSQELLRSWRLEDRLRGSAS